MIDAIDEVTGQPIRRVSVEYGGLDRESFSGGTGSGTGRPDESQSQPSEAMNTNTTTAQNANANTAAAAAVESLRTADMNYDDNSAVEYAMSKANKRLSVTRLKTTEFDKEKKIEKKEKKEKEKAERASREAQGTSGSESDTPKPKVKLKKKEKAKNAEGKLISQGHEQYALTYGMMLGIRVSVSG